MQNLSPEVTYFFTGSQNQLLDCNHLTEQLLSKATYLNISKARKEKTALEKPYYPHCVWLAFKLLYLKG